MDEGARRQGEGKEGQGERARGQPPEPKLVRRRRELQQMDAGEQGRFDQNEGLTKELGRMIERVQREAEEYLREKIGSWSSRRLLLLCRGVFGVIIEECGMGLFWL